MTDVLCRINDLSVTSVSGKRVLSNINLDLHAGEIILLSGASGSGKSTFLNALADVLDRGNWTISGDIVHANDPQHVGHRRTNGVGAMVFQNFALFDDMTAVENIRIAMDHAGVRSTSVNMIDLLLRDIHPHHIAEQMSGGQKQRVAIARTLVAGHSVLLFDEPNSGLDTVNTKNLTKQIKQLASANTHALIIVAHHFHGILSVVDRVWFLNQSGSIEELPPCSETIEERLLDNLKASDTKQEHGDKIEEWASFLKTTRISNSTTWFLYFFYRYFIQLCASPLLLIYIAIGGVLSGFVSIWFSFQNLPYKQYLGEFVEADLLVGLGVFQFRVLAPLIAALLLVARNGAIISADIGHRVHARQFKAMRNLNLPYKQYFVGAITLNSILAAWLMFAVAWLASAWVSLFTWQMLHPLQPSGLWHELYFQSLYPPPSLVPEGSTWVFAKMTISGGACAIASLWAGFGAKSSVLDINRGIAVALVAGTLAVLLIHTIFAFLEF